MQITLDGLPLALKTLDRLGANTPQALTRALFRIGGEWKKTAVFYAPISPSTSLLRQFAKGQAGGGSDANTIHVAGRKGQSGQAVKLTAFYAHRLESLIGQGSNKNAPRPMPGGLMRSIQISAGADRVAVFVPSNSPAGSYAFKIDEEKGKTWKHRGPGTQARGTQADDKFIFRAARDRAKDFLAIVRNEIDKLLTKNGGL